MEHPTIEKIKAIANLMLLTGVGKSVASANNHVANRLGFNDYEHMIKCIQIDPTLLQKKEHKINALHDRTAALKKIYRKRKNKKPND